MTPIWPYLTFFGPSDRNPEEKTKFNCLLPEAYWYDVNRNGTIFEFHTTICYIISVGVYNLICQILERSSMSQFTSGWLSDHFRITSGPFPLTALSWDPWKFAFYCMLFLLQIFLWVRNATKCLYEFELIQYMPIESNASFGRTKEWFQPIIMVIFNFEILAKFFQKIRKIRMKNHTKFLSDLHILMGLIKENDSSRPVSLIKILVLIK